MQNKSRKRRFWDNKLTSISTIKDITNLPYFGFQFFLRNLGTFKLSFVTLSLVSVLATIIRFSSTYILSNLLSNISDLSTDTILRFYLPLFITLMISAEVLDFFTRKYAEAFPIVYTNYLSLMFYKTILTSHFHCLFNYSKGKLNIIINKYNKGVREFLADWIWGLPKKLTTFAIIIILLYLQNPIILLVNAIYIVIFLTIAIRISSKFSKVVQQHSKQEIETDSIIQSFTLNLNAIKSQFLEGFFQNRYKQLTKKNWGKFKQIRDFHANRWFLQLNLFNIIYIGTFFYGIYQVIEGTLPLGFLLLLHWAYSKLWEIIVYTIEYTVRLIEQKEDTKIVRAQFSKILSFDNTNKREKFPRNWNKIVLHKVKTYFRRRGEKKIEISVPLLEIRKGAKIGIIGKSGSGKSTVFKIITGLVNFRGKIHIDNLPLDTIKLTR